MNNNNSHTHTHTHTFSLSLTHTHTYTYTHAHTHTHIHTQAKLSQLALEDMTGGTFTISNGGVFGSLFGTPIINIPQSAILGMHATKMR